MLPSIPCTYCPVQSGCIFCTSKLSSISQFVDALISFHYKKGQLLFQEGDKKKGVYFIKKGKIKCTKGDLDGNEVIVKFAKEGEVLGYSSLYLLSESYEYASVSMEDSEICFLPLHGTKEALQRNFDLLKSIFQIQYLDKMFMIRTITNLSVKNVRERIACSIDSLMEKFGKDPEGFIDIAITREEIANMSATTTESAIRYMSEFQKGNIIQIKNKKIKILNLRVFNNLVGKKQ